MCDTEDLFRVVELVALRRVAPRAAAAMAARCNAEAIYQYLWISSQVATISRTAAVAKPSRSGSIATEPLGTVPTFFLLVTRCGWASPQPRSFGCGCAALRCSAELHPAKRRAALKRFELATPRE